MDDKNYSLSFTVHNTPEEVFSAVVNPRAWWSTGITGETDKLHAEFIHQFADAHRCKIKITELVPNTRVVWHVVENFFNFTRDPEEWKDTDIVFEISANKESTELRFTHVGLTPKYECYDICSNAWGTYITGSLKELIETGTGSPTSETQPRTDKEAEIISSSVT